MCKKNVQTGCTEYIHKAAMRMMENSEYFTVYKIESCKCYLNEFEFRSLIARGKKLLLSLSVFPIMIWKHLPDGSKMKRLLPGWFESLMILAALLLQRLR